MEEQIVSEKTQIERKIFYFDLKQNARGRFLKLTEDVRGRRDTIIVPSTGLVEFKEILERIIEAESELEPLYDEDEEDEGEYEEEDEGDYDEEGDEEEDEGEYEEEGDEEYDDEDEDDMEESPSFSEILDKKSKRR